MAQGKFAEWNDRSGVAGRLRVWCVGGWGRGITGGGLKWRRCEGKSRDTVYRSCPGMMRVDKRERYPRRMN